MNYVAEAVLRLAIDCAKERARADYMEGKVELLRNRCKELESEMDKLRADRDAAVDMVWPNLDPLMVNKAVDGDAPRDTEEAKDDPY